MSLDIWNRRYTGSKFKLASWINELIKENCNGKSFCDIFAGTGVVAATQLNNFDEIVLNDFLYSNNIIYNAFFLNESYSLDKLQNLIHKWSSVKIEDIEENYTSINFGGKYFSTTDAKIIGFFRDKIEYQKNNLTNKEYYILLASLIYSADKIANTVGHYDAYIKNKTLKDKFKFIFIKPLDTSKKSIKIFRQDANQLAKQIKCDVVYIDPPYNSRQYSRFYHLLETITHGKSPELFGTALKPRPENMSDYCRVSAKNTFEELIKSLNCKYIVVSYNNTYNSKSKSSRNKIEQKDLIDILKNKGDLKIFEKSHQCFNAGKTEFNDHKEYIFIVEVRNLNGSY